MESPAPTETSLQENIILEDQKTPKVFSDVWSFFVRLPMAKDGIGRAECKACNTIYKCGAKMYGTSTLRRHLPKCKKIRFGDVRQIIVDKEGKLRSRRIDPKIARGLLVDAVIQHDLNFSFVEYRGMRNFLKYVNHDLGVVSRNTMSSDIAKLHMREKDKLKQLLSCIRSRICLTSDCWTACTSEGFICLTAHFIDDNWNLHSKILNFAHMPPPHFGVELAARIFGFLTDWGIEKNVFSLTLDNATNNDNMQDILKEQLSLHDSLLCDGEFFHIRCSAHILNLIVNEGLEVATTALSKIRDSVKYVKGSEGRKKKFQQCVEQVGNIDTSIGLRLDVATRWNSTYLMLDIAIRYKKVFASLQLNDRNYKYCPSALEWSRAEKICEFLEPFYITTNLIFGSTYPTSNLYFMQVWKIQRLLQENKLSEDLVIRDICVGMLETFEKYWSEYSVVLAFGVVFDPRIKVSLLEYFYSKVEMDEVKCQEKVALVKPKLYKLFEKYDISKNSSSSQLELLSSSKFASKRSGGGSTCGQRMFDEIILHESQTITKAGKSELDIYLEELKFEFAHHLDLDVMGYWKNNQHRFPSLALMAADVLAIPITTVASESAFSIGSRVLTKYRSCTLPDKVQALICTRNWLHGYACDVEEDAQLNKALGLNVEVEPTIIHVDDEVEENEDDQEEDNDI